MPGQIDYFAADGTVIGWFRNPSSDSAAIARIVFSDGTAARVVGDRFRRDLLERGVSHGHFGFLLQAPAVISAGAFRATLLDDKTGDVVATAERSCLRAFQNQSCPLLLHVEDIIANGENWTCEDIAKHVSNLAVAETYNSAGAEVFVERLAHYCFGEFPSEAIMDGFIDALESGAVSPEHVFIAMLQTKSASDKTGQSLPGPYSPEYPLDLIVIDPLLIS